MFQVLLGMNTNVSGRPIEWSDSSAEDILAGVDFLSVFMSSAEERKNYNHQPEITTNHPTPFEELIIDHFSTTTIDNSISNKNEENKESPTTIDNNINNEESSFTTILPEETEKPEETEELTTVSPNSQLKENSQITFQNTNKNEENHQTTRTKAENKSVRFIPKGPEITTKRGIFVKNHPSAIQSNSKRNVFNIDITEPLTVESQKPENKVKRKSEDLLAIGANPDYIAQQHARINRENQYNHPYNQRNPTSSRGRSVSYSTVIQVLPPGNVKNWKQEDETRNSGIAGDDYDYTESYPEYGNKNTTFKQHVASTAESKDYFVTRKYNPGEFNESGDKEIPNSNLEVKKNYQTTERNWGFPEKVYGVPEKNYGIPETPQAQYGRMEQKQSQPEIVNYQTTERNWGIPEKQYGIADTRNPPYGRPEQNYEVDESISVRTNGRTHGVQNPSNPSNQKVNEKPLQSKVGQAPVKPDDNQKVGYVVEGRNYRKYRVEERTADGFIVGEYGVVSNNDGSLRGVRYTADGTINPRVIYDALMKFLAL